MCFAVVVGRKASADGAVLFGHNEQNFGKQYINYRMIPRQSYQSGEGIALQKGGIWPFCGETYRFLWTESPGLEFSDNCFNEWGVAVAGDGCSTIEDDIARVTARGDISDGGVGYMLPRLIAMLARTAQEGIDVLESVIERFGYTGSGRSLIIADPREAWIVSLARGKNWMARRVPDDQVVVVPNRHVLTAVPDLNDQANVRYSRGLFAYVRSRGWYSDQTGEPFNFAKVFNANPNPETMTAHYGVDPRQWQGQQLITGTSIAPDSCGELPFAVSPHKPLAVRDVMRVLRSHLEGTSYDLRPQQSSGSPHQPEAKIDHCFARSICNIATQESVVFQLRHWLPADIGCLAWRAASVPCSNGFTPWYLGITETPSNLFAPCSIAEQLDLEHHFKSTSEHETAGQKLAFWQFYRLAQQVDKVYAEQGEKVLAQWEEFESEQFAQQAGLEAEALSCFKQDKSRMQQVLTRYCHQQFQAALQLAENMLSQMA